MISSFRFFRYNFYETFYALHVFLVPLTLFTAGMHHPSVGWWCWSALVIWVAERAWRGTWWFWVNGIFKRKMPNAPPREKSFNHVSRKSSISTLGLKMGAANLDSISEYSATEYEALLLRKHSRVPTKVESLMSPPDTYVPPPGYALAELMPGKTIRLTVLTPECRPWAPGQHFLLSIPSINKFTSHPFTVGSICDQESSNPAGRVLIFIRAKAGPRPSGIPPSLSVPGTNSIATVKSLLREPTPQIAVYCSRLSLKDPSARLRGLIGSSIRACCW